MITVVCGGPGSLQLIRGLRILLQDTDITAVVTTGDALDMGSGHLCQTLDSTLFAFAGILNSRRGTGVKGDSYTTNRFLAGIGRPETVAVGDRERATQIARAGLLEEGLSLTAATAVLASGLGITAAVLPATDDYVRVQVETATGTVPLAVFREDTSVEVVRAGLSCPRPPRATQEVLGAIEKSDAVIIGPDPPLSGIEPVLACRGIEEALKERFVIALSPWWADSPLPAYEEAIFCAEGFEPSSAGVRAIYGTVCDLFVQDRRDPCCLEGALALDIQLAGRRMRESLAWDLMSVIRRRSHADS
jgi:LPPG:FO 2-phospho-L-lactate transferase